MDKYTWNLKDIIDFIKEKIQIKKIYLFGSRAYKTGSSVSDIDLLVVMDKLIPIINTFA